MGIKIIAQNKKARHDYFIEDTFEAGIKLKGSEIKSVRLGKVNINDAFVNIKNGELLLLNSHISKFEQSSIFNHEEKRNRTLLMHKREILKLRVAKEKEGFTIIPLSIYLKKGLCKVEIAIAKGKKNYDKRETLKRKDQELHLKRLMSRSKQL